MDITIYPQKLQGTITAVPSKSQAHRLLICAAFSDKQTTLICPETNRDIQATVSCLQALGANIRYENGQYIIDPIVTPPRTATLPCAESGSTLRFMLPIAGAMGVDATFTLDGSLCQRPLSPLWEEMARMGCILERPAKNTIRCHGKLRCGNYAIDGSISSQFISGLLFAMALMDGTSILTVTGKAESEPYIKMTQDALAVFGISSDDFTITGGQRFLSPGIVCIEGDWSNSAFFLTANALGSNITINNLQPNSPQGDKIITGALNQLSLGFSEISGADIPDLIPILSIAAAANSGATFTDIGRLRMKESDRILSVATMLQSMGIQTESTDNSLTLYPGDFQGGTVDAFNDHRIAMSAAIAATVANGPVTILGANCVDKSYPSFWDEYLKLGGSYEQHIRK